MPDSKLLNPTIPETLWRMLKLMDFGRVLTQITLLAKR